MARLSRQPCGGMVRLPNGRGPFRAIVSLSVPGCESVARARICCGGRPKRGFAGKVHRRSGSAPCEIVVMAHRPGDRKLMGWFWECNDPVQAEAVASVVACLGDVTTEQLERIGFVQLVGPGLNSGAF